MTAYGYIRPNERFRKGSAEYQKQQILKWAEEHKILMDENNFFIDQENVKKLHMSERPAGKQLLAILQPGDILLCCSLGVLSRGANSLYLVLKDISSKGARLQIVGEELKFLEENGLIEMLTPQNMRALNLIAQRILRYASLESNKLTHEIFGRLRHLPFGIEHITIKKRNRFDGKRKEDIYKWVDDIRVRFGPAIICYGASMGYPPKAVVNEIKMINFCRKYQKNLPTSLSYECKVTKLWRDYQFFPQLVEEAIAEYRTTIRLNRDEIEELLKSKCPFRGFIASKPLIDKSERTKEWTYGLIINEFA